MLREFHLTAPDLPSRDAEAWLADRVAAAPTPRQASTVLILRDGEVGVDDGGPEVFVLRRVSTMDFAASMWVFPGGGVDARDAQATPWAGPSVVHWARTLGTDEASAEQLVCAAVREVFEECGVLLAGPDERSVVADLRSPAWREARADLVERRRSLTEVLTDAGLVLRSDLLTYRAHWVTPAFERRRFDTRFFAAQLPQGQQPDDETSETDLAHWVRPGRLLDDFAAGDAGLMPPTLVCLEELAAAGTVADYLAQRVEVREVQPWLEVDPGDGRLVLRARVPQVRA